MHQVLKVTATALADDILDLFFCGLMCTNNLKNVKAQNCVCNINTYTGCRASQVTVL